MVSPIRLSFNKVTLPPPRIVASPRRGQALQSLPVCGEDNIHYCLYAAISLITALKKY